MKRNAPLNALLIASLLFTMACSDTVDGGGTTPQTSGDTTTAEATGRKDTPDSLPSDLNFGGQTITLISRQDVEL